MCILHIIIFYEYGQKGLTNMWPFWWKSIGFSSVRQLVILSTFLFSLKKRGKEKMIMDHAAKLVLNKLFKWFIRFSLPFSVSLETFKLKYFAQRVLVEDYNWRGIVLQFSKSLRKKDTNKLISINFKLYTEVP